MRRYTRKSGNQSPPVTAPPGLRNELVEEIGQVDAMIRSRGQFRIPAGDRLARAALIGETRGMFRVESHQHHHVILPAARGENR
jgi:hypothetical protein